MRHAPLYSMFRREYLLLSQLVTVCSLPICLPAPFSSTIMDNAKKLAAFKAIEDNVKENMTIGIGSGSTIVYAVFRLKQIVDERHLSVACVPTSFQAKQLIRKYGLVLSDLEDNPQLDVAFDGADEVDANRTLIKGGGGCLTQEKIVASAAKRLLIIGDWTKKSNFLGQNWTKGLPIEVIPMSYVVVKNKIEKTLGGKAELRMAVAKAGPLVTDNGNFIIDWKFEPNRFGDWNAVNTQLLLIPGVIETGLFIGMAEKCYYGNQDGTVSIQ